MVRDLIIFGMGPHAQEMADIVEHINCAAPTWNLLGFLVSEAQANNRGKKLNGYPVLGSYMDLPAFPQALFVPEYGSNAPVLTREQMASLIAPTAFVSRTARIGVGCVLYPHCFVGANAVLRDNVFVLSNSVINHDDHVEDNVTLCSGVRLAGSVHIEADSYLGQACTVRQLLRIGRGSLIGMGSVVIADVPANSVMAGNPARKLRDRTP